MAKPYDSISYSSKNNINFKTRVRWNFNPLQFVHGNVYGNVNQMLKSGYLDGKTRDYLNIEPLDTRKLIGKTLMFLYEFTHLSILPFIRISIRYDGRPHKWHKHHSVSFTTTFSMNVQSDWLYYMFKCTIPYTDWCTSSLVGKNLER